MNSEALKVLLFYLVLYPSVSVQADKLPADDLDSLQLVQVIFRHGDRTPFGQTFPNDPYGDLSYWPEGWGQLTLKGKRVQYKLGQYLRSRYDGFLSRKYSTSEVYARSSDLDRTIASAMVNLAGLYPPEGVEEIWNEDIKWQPIPVHTIPAKIDNKINFVANCPKYKLRLEQLLDSKFIKRINAQNEELLGYLSKYSGRQVKDFIPVGEIHDSLTIQKQNGLKLPDWTLSIFPDKMLPLSIFPFEAITFTEEMTKLRGGPLLHEIINVMDINVGNVNLSCAEQKYFHKAKLYMYSGHDSTVTTLLTALGAYDRAHIPSYSSMIMIELHRKNNGGVPFVKVFYRNESGNYPRPIRISGCENFYGICYLENFKKALTHHTLSDEEFETFCKVSENDHIYVFPEQSSNFEAAGFLQRTINHLTDFGGAFIEWFNP